jgi:hypothetical protein
MRDSMQIRGRVGVRCCQRACNAMRLADVTCLQHGAWHVQALSVVAGVYTLGPRLDGNSWVLISQGDNYVCVLDAYF